uniref:Small ribosomal subunit protein uS14c n=2 Tax=Welwitschia mirabilis TaxID=3377 RepID=RR14_WELMI|nr:ribosomal protein S14 [Welwitschia mirabilis]B2Y1U8.1 RecName: Full=Small ribosomal subunit protein uS14c; AltName: Full=30S ribosomal protein S14, chloroplastic [Welwitschia mirabilis]ABY26778.1 ribosomal protein S14 [Welwitschia mirabilis]AMA21041.1 ribosomal protein S14 [Welwitschia mirabilis]BAH11171.1 ribosomal protein S14 [Welwitschia mirabilis]
MAKKSLIEREKKRQRLVRKYRVMREYLKKKEKQVFSLEEKSKIKSKLQSLPRNSAPTRLHRRCVLTGRSRGIYRDFGLCRHIIREKAHACLLPGITKSS